MKNQAQEMQDFEKARAKAHIAQNALLTKIFGQVPNNPNNYVCTREEYEKAMLETEKEYGYNDGNPDLVLFVLEQLSRTPRFITSEERDKECIESAQATPKS